MNSIAFGLSTLLFLYTLLGEPLLGVRWHNRLVAQLKTDSSARSGFYLRLVVQEWAWVVAIVLILLGVQHPLVSIGLQEPNAPGWPFLAGAALGLAVLTAVSLFLPKYRDFFQAQLAPAAALLPVTARERLGYAAICLTAGWCEELLYRGFLIFYLTIVLPWLPVALVIIAAGAIFGLGHAYQGRKGMLTSGLMGILLGALYWWTGSLLPGMILHTLIDLRAMLYWPPRISRPM
jgi:membrane protease YdiL (CAAX protease family)